MTKVFVSGCFNALHSGHVYFFNQAKSLGTHLTVCVPSDRVLWEYKQQKQIIPLQHKVEVIKALEAVDDVVIGDDLDPNGLNFRTEFLRVHPEILAVTEDDKYSKFKKELCKEIKCKYVVLPKELNIEPTSSTDVINFIKAPSFVPLRVDFAGGWLDVPKYSMKGGYIVNCSISPCVSLQEWGYKQKSGLGGSAAYAILSGKNGVQSELDLGVGWQDPAIIQETGLCVWASGMKPKLIIKKNPEWLNGKIALLWGGSHHDTPAVVDNSRDYDLIYDAGNAAFTSVISEDINTLSLAINLSYKAQIKEGMEKLPTHNELAKKYAGGGWGCYGIYLFKYEEDRDEFLQTVNESIAVEPYIKQY
jgi:cytidyltransferase-like protein